MYRSFSTGLYALIFRRPSKWLEEVEMSRGNFQQYFHCFSLSMVLTFGCQWKNLQKSRTHFKDKVVNTDQKDHQASSRVLAMLKWWRPSDAPIFFSDTMKGILETSILSTFTPTISPCVTFSCSVSPHCFNVSFFWSPTTVVRTRSPP